MRPNLTVLRGAIGPMLTESGQIGSLQLVTNPDTGMEEEQFVATFAGPVLVRPEGGVEYISVGGTTRPQRDYDVTFPAETVVVVGDVLVLDEIPHDPAMSGASITITDVPLDPWQVARFCKGTRAG